MPKFVVGLILVVQLLIFPTLSLAALGDPKCNDPNTPTSLRCIPYFIGNLADKAFIFAGICAVFFVAFGGIKLITSSGDPQRVESAKKTLTFAIIGLLIILLSFVIIKFTAKVTNVNCKVIGIGGC